MDEQVQLLTSVRDILTRIERLLERIEGNGGMVPAAPAEPAPAEPAIAEAAPIAAAPSMPAASPATFGRAKWTKR